VVIDPRLFDVVDRYIDEFPKLSRRKQRLRSAHPLVVFTKALLEQFAAAALTSPDPIAGLNERTFNQLVAVRRQLEGAGEETGALQRLIQAFEPMCDVVAEASYEIFDEATAEFHNEHFPHLLERLAEWAEGEGAEPLQLRARQALAQYRSRVRVGR
jgi:hypothetical protein